MSKFLEILAQPGVDTLLLTVVGLSAIAVYFKQRSDQIIGAAKLIKLEIDSIEEAIDKLRNKAMKDYEMVYRSTPIFQNLEWFTLRNMIVSRMRPSHLSSINTFYSGAVFLEEARLTYKRAVDSNRISKIEAIQGDISKIFVDQVEALIKPVSWVELENMDQQKQIPVDTQIRLTNRINQSLNEFSNIYDKIWLDFVPLGISNYYFEAIGTFSKISNTPAYDYIDRLSRRWFTF